MDDRKTISAEPTSRRPFDDARWATRNCRPELEPSPRAAAFADGSELATDHLGMPRAPHRNRHALNGAESNDSESFGGLADVLEPDADAITSLRGVPAASVRHPSLRTVAPAQVQDFAFADTVYANELPDDGPPPPSGPIFVQDPMGHTQCVTPLAFPLPVAADDVSLPTRLRNLLAHARHAFRRSADEMGGLWADTDAMVDRSRAGTGRHLRRVLALWSIFHWSRADLTRAAMIGLAVFVTAATLGAATLGGGDEAAAAAAGDGVRGQRTLDQHTGKNFVPRSKR
jgi:hypothetical protein